MKKYLFGLLAIVLAIGFSAFTKPAKQSTIDYYYFAFSTANGGDITNPEHVADLDRWLFTGDDESVPTDLNCGEAEDPYQACEIAVDEALLDEGSITEGQSLEDAQNSGTIVLGVDRTGEDLPYYVIDESPTVGVFAIYNREENP